uniref:Uncharacterized protein LOC101491121 n=1 Tax=Rhizophora mucronata TaxID=61149 RepID=A0A2P2L5A8_RHIMU
MLFLQSAYYLVLISSASSSLHSEHVFCTWAINNKMGKKLNKKGMKLLILKVTQYTWIAPNT